MGGPGNQLERKVRQTTYEHNRMSGKGLAPVIRLIEVNPRDKRAAGEARRATLAEEPARLPESRLTPQGGVLRTPRNRPKGGLPRFEFTERSHWVLCFPLVWWWKMTNYKKRTSGCPAPAEPPRTCAQRSLTPPRGREASLHLLGRLTDNPLLAPPGD